MECCGNCKWQRYEKDSQSWVCTNMDSEYVSDWTEYNHTCDQWEERT